MPPKTTQQTFRRTHLPTAFPDFPTNCSRSARRSVPPDGRHPKGAGGHVWPPARALDRQIRLGLRPSITLNLPDLQQVQREVREELWKNIYYEKTLISIIERKGFVPEPSLTSLNQNRVGVPVCR